MKTFNSVKTGQHFTWQGSHIWLKKTGDTTAAYATGGALPACDSPDAFRVIGKVKWPTQ